MLSDLGLGFGCGFLLAIAFVGADELLDIHGAREAEFFLPGLGVLVKVVRE